jgi:HAD superfamily hydrolase (TIGR01509 family)
MKAFIFDMDGVIVDSEPLHSRVKLATFRHYGIAFAEPELEKYMGRTTRALFQDAVRTAGRTDIDVEEMIAYKHALYLDILRHDDAVQPVAGIMSLCRELAACHIPAALASSAARIVIEALLKKFGLADYFQSVLSGADLPKGKPDPAVYLLSAERLGVNPADCVVLEDAASGVAAAKAAGMYCIAYHNPHSGQQDLARADEIVESIKDISLGRLK